MTTLAELRTKSVKLLSDLRAIHEKAKAENRDLNTEERESYEKLEADLDANDEVIEREEKLEKREATSREPATTRANIAPESPEGKKSGMKMETFRSWLKHGASGMLTMEEQRDLAQGASQTGGALVPPEEFVNRLIKAVDDFVFIRQAATKLTVVGAASLGVPSLDTDPADADWTSEVATGSADTAMAFGKRTLAPSPLAKRIKVSQTLLRNAAMNVEDLVIQRLAYKFAITEEKAFMTGDGNSKPLGLFTANAQGISTARDVSTGNTDTTVTYDGLIEAQSGVDDQYWGNSKWLISPALRKMVRKIKDGDGQYVWQQDVKAGVPTTLLGNPVIVSKYVPATFTTGLYVGLFGDLSFYWIADALSMQMQRLVELYAEANQIGFIGRLECDAMPVLESAFSRIKLA